MKERDVIYWSWRIYIGFKLDGFFRNIRVSKASSFACRVKPHCCQHCTFICYNKYVWTVVPVQHVERPIHSLAPPFPYLMWSCCGLFMGNLWNCSKIHYSTLLPFASLCSWRVYIGFKLDDVFYSEHQCFKSFSFACRVKTLLDVTLHYCTFLTLTEHHNQTSTFRSTWHAALDLSSTGAPLKLNLGRPLQKTLWKWWCPWVLEY